MSDYKQNGFNTSELESVAAEMKKNFNAAEELMKEFSETHKPEEPDPHNLSDAYSKWFVEAVKNPEKIMQDTMNFWTKSLQLTQQAFTGAFTEDNEVKPAPVITEEKGDRRFKHEDWTEKSIW